tara:strand:+ start:24 stop:146 length:123 start_codon:yes stop_codon:yes gene_type:complete
MGIIIPFFLEVIKRLVLLDMLIFLGKNALLGVNLVHYIKK